MRLFLQGLPKILTTDKSFIFFQCLSIILLAVIKLVYIYFDVALGMPLIPKMSDKMQTEGSEHILLPII